ncbi:hypothetical protein Zmor_021062 [Zophobas morio]|uniref:DUF7041 domain-containing protein n=1 Tax=Zophobas morio TaxID=2755281 RepID=A0AA38MAS0_9CUCU|nr:hypothetical protein Zmor_021062 [Zophobas morio]
MTSPVELSQSSETAESEQINAAVGSLPPFWNHKPELWFAIIEVKFDLANVTIEKTKYNHTVGALPPEIASEVADMITALKPEDQQPYSKLRRAILARLTLSETQKVQQLLSELELGSRKPSQLYRQMITLVGEGSNNSVNEQVLRELFMQQMPQNNIKPVLISLGDKLAEVADKILKAAPMITISTITTRGDDAPTDDANSPLSILVKKMDELIQLQRESTSDYNRCRHGNRKYNNYKRTLSASRSITKGDQNVNVCWYHTKFGDKAPKCKGLDCQFSKNGNSRQELG